MSSAIFQDTSNGDPFYEFQHTSNRDPFYESQQQFEDDFSSTMRWAVVGSVVSGLVMTIAIVAIVYAIIDCLKKAGTAIPSYAKIATRDSDITEEKASNPVNFSSNNEVKIGIPPDFPVISESQVEFATMERFLSNMAREKPVRFSPDQLSAFTDNYSTILGSGGFGVVFQGFFPNGVQVAVKVLSSNWDKRVEEQFMAEVGTLGRTYHINLVRLYGFCFDPSMRALVYEYMENGSLDRLLFGENNRDIEWDMLHSITVQTAKGLAYLHEECERKIIHYDIKPGNVLLDKNLNPKVADFGLAKLFSRESSQNSLMADGRGTPGYAAPEMWKPYPVTHKCDVYSFGMLLFEVVGRRRNFDDSLSESRTWLPRWTWEMYENNELPVMLSLFGIAEKDRDKAEKMAMVALLCIQYLPEARPLMSNVVQMLEGSKEITPPSFPFQEHSPTPNLTGGSETNSEWNTSSGTTISKQIQSNRGSQAICEIELAGL